MCRERRPRPSLRRLHEAKARELRRRHQDAVGDGGSHGTSEDYGSDARSEGWEAPAKTFWAPEPGKAPAQWHYWVMGR